MHLYGQAGWVDWDIVFAALNDELNPFLFFHEAKIEIDICQAVLNLFYECREEEAIAE
jgi:hypothetical protein